MKAFLLAAGLGTRLRPLTDEMPKCLLPVCGKQLLEIWLELLDRHGVDEVLVNTHWRREKVEKHIKDRSQWSEVRSQGKTEDRGQRAEVRRQETGDRRQETGDRGQKEDEGVKIRRAEVGGQGKTEVGDQRSEVRRKRKGKREKAWPGVRLFYEKELLGSAGTLLVNREWVADGRPFFILYGDNLTNVDLGRMYEFHLGHGLPFTLGVFKADEPERCGIAEVDEDWVVTGFAEKPDRPKSDLAAAGIYVADQRIFDFFPEDAELTMPLDLGFHVIPRLIGRMKAYFVEEFLMDIGTPESYEKAQIIWGRLDRCLTLRR